MYETWRKDENGQPCELLGIYPTMVDAGRAIEADAALRGEGAVYYIVEKVEASTNAET